MKKLVPGLFCASRLVSQGTVGLIQALLEAGLKSAAKILSAFSTVFLLYFINSGIKDEFSWRFWSQVRTIF